MKKLTILAALASCLLFMGCAGPDSEGSPDQALTDGLEIQPHELPRRSQPYSWSSGLRDGSGSAGARAALAASHTVSIPGGQWLQLELGDAELGAGSYVEIASLRDSAVQRLDAATMAQWNHRSAFFNGDAVEVRLFVAPEDSGVSIDVRGVMVGERESPSRSLCGVDDRVASTEPRVGRIDPIGCTGWIVDSGKHVTAGHCLAGGSRNVVLSFNPPASLPDGTVQFPAPEDQYMIDPRSFKLTNLGVGNDWGVFDVFDNAITGRQPIEAQGAFGIARDLEPADLRVTGFGVTGGSSNQTIQTHVGPNVGSTDTVMRYATDTTGGNSGSPIIDEATGLAVGIHTHGGCFADGGGANHGTSFFHPDLSDALGLPDPDSPRRVFVSSAIFTGNLGGLAGGDQKCQDLADAAGLGGTYKAWLSDSRESPSTRFTQSTAPYVLVDGTGIADNWDDLVSGSLINPINKDERGLAPPLSEGICPDQDMVLTGTLASGRSDASRTCSNWTRTTGTMSVRGRYNAVTRGWSAACASGGPNDNHCRQRAPIYCFEQ